MTTMLPSGTVTFLFTDIEGSTRLLHALGERYRPLLDEHHRLIRRSVEIRGGVVMQTMGDGVFAAFANATAAVGAAVDAQRALAAFDWPVGGNVRVRMGLHSGEATAVDGEYVSLAVHHAARVGDSGHGGQIVVSDTTRALLDGTEADFSFRDLGPHRLKDLTHAVRLHQVCHPDLHDGFPPLRSLDRVAHNLPVQLTTFVGRADELVEVTKLLDEHRLVTLTGAGGSGKTRLALHVAADVAHDFDGGVWYVELAPVIDEDAVVFAVCDAMHVQAQPGRSPRELVLERLAGPATLLLLDNCEHVLNAAGDITAEILAHCPYAKVLVTSREPLGVPGETVWRVPSMSTTDVFGEPTGGDALRLFLERANLVRPGWVPGSDAERAAVIEVCARLDGIPLAIELAAARLDVLDVTQIRDRLHDRFKLLTGGSRVTLERQRTLRATVDWSHALLDDRAKVLLRRLAVFVGGFTLEAAEAVCTDDHLPADDVLDLLGDLVRKSLVVDDRTRSPRRYAMLETIRQYALESLLAADESFRIQTAHYDWALGVVDQTWLAKDFVGRDWYALAANEDAEHDNIIAALTWAADLDDPSRLDELLIRCGRWATLGHYNLLYHWVEVALSHPGPRPDHVRGRLLLDRAVSVYRLGDLAAARGTFAQAVPLLAGDPEPSIAIYKLQIEGILVGDEGDNEGQRRANDEAIALCRQHGYRAREAALLSNQSTALVALGDGDGAMDLLRQSRDAARAANAPVAEAYATVNLVAGLFSRGQWGEADALLEEAHDLVTRVGDGLLLHGVLVMRFFRTLRHDLEAADGIARDQVALARRTGLVSGEVFALNNAGVIAFQRGDNASAARLMLEAQRKWLPSVTDESAYVAFDAFALLARGDLDAALATVESRYRPGKGDDTQVGTYVSVVQRDAAGMRRWLDRADAAAARVGRRERTSDEHMLVGLIALLEGDPKAARAPVATALAIQTDDDHYLWALDSVEALAAIAVATGDAETAGACLGLAAAVRDALGMRTSMVGLHTWTDATRSTAEATDADAFAAGWKRGQAAGVDGFFALATELVGATD